MVDKQYDTKILVNLTAAEKRALEHLKRHQGADSISEVVRDGIERQWMHFFPGSPYPDDKPKAGENVTL